MLSFLVNLPHEFPPLILWDVSWQIGVLKKELESVRKHRKQYRNRRLSVPVPVVSLVSIKMDKWNFDNLFPIAQLFNNN